MSATCPPREHGDHGASRSGSNFPVEAPAERRLSWQPEFSHSSIKRPSSWHSEPLPLRLLRRPQPHVGYDSKRSQTRRLRLPTDGMGLADESLPDALPDADSIKTQQDILLPTDVASERLLMVGYARDHGFSSDDKVSGLSRAPAIGAVAGDPLQVRTGSQAGENDPRIGGGGDLSSATVPQPPSQEVATTQRRVRRVNRLADQTLLAQYELAHKQSAFDSCQDYLDQSINSLMAEISNHRSDQQPKSSWESVQEKYDAVQQDRMMLQNRSSELTLTSQKLSTLQHKLKTETEKLQESLHSLSGTVLQPFSIQASVSVSASEPSTDSTRSQVASPVPSVLAAYREMKADGGILHEQMHDLKALHMEELERREFIKERGDTVSVTTEDFNARFASQLQPLEAELESVDAELHRLAQRCLASGLQPKVAYSAIASDVQSLTQHASDDEPSAKPLEPLHEPTTANSNALDTVRSWLPSLEPTSVPPGAGGSIFEYQIQTQTAIAAISSYYKQRLAGKWSTLEWQLELPRRPLSCPPCIDTAEPSHDWDLVSSLQVPESYR